MSRSQPTPPATPWPAAADLRAQTHQQLDTLLDFAAAAPPALSFLAFEKHLLALLLVLGRTLVLLFLTQRHRQLDLAAWLTRGYRLADAAAPRTLTTVFGPVSYRRAYLIARHGTGPGVHPLDAELGLTRDGFSPLLIGWCCRLATRVSFRLASNLVGMFLGWSPPASTIQQWTQGLGRSAQVFLTSGPLPEGDGEVLVIEVDGKAVPTATEAELHKRRRPHGKHQDGSCGCPRHRRRECRNQRGRKKKRKKGDKSKNGRSATLVVLYTLRRDAAGKLHGPINKKVYATFGSRKQAAEWARAQATRRGFGPDTDKTVQIVVDGEVCLEQRLRALFPKAIVTLDIRHAQEKLWQVGRLFHREGSAELTAWVEVLEGWLYQGEIDKILARLGKALREVAARGPGTKGKREKLAAVIGYLSKRQGLMAYGEWRAADLVIASGVVEGAARYVVGERLDNAGMRWIEERAEAVLQLRCIEVNGDWDAYWEWADQERRRTLGCGLPVQIRSKDPTPLPEAA